MQIVGIMLVRNEDRFVGQALRNVLPFCDRMIVANHQSTDRTGEIVDELRTQYPNLDHYHIRHGHESHTLIQEFAGTPTWVFAVDGDEIYDPEGLVVLRQRLETGEFDSWWIVFGNVLNCIILDESNKNASGYLAPPCRSMTKLYNFNTITAWDGPCGERLHDGRITFKPGYDASKRLNLHESLSWEESPYRCLHMCFLSRSSLERKSDAPIARPSMIDFSMLGPLRSFLYRVARCFGLSISVSPVKKGKYMRGALMTKDVTPFFVDNLSKY